MNHLVEKDTSAGWKIFRFTNRLGGVHRGFRDLLQMLEICLRFDLERLLELLLKYKIRNRHLSSAFKGLGTTSKALRPNCDT